MDNVILEVSQERFTKIKNKEITLLIIDKDESNFDNIHNGDTICLKSSDDTLNVWVIQTLHLNITDLNSSIIDSTKAGYTRENIYDSFIKEHNVDDLDADIRTIEFVLI